MKYTVTDTETLRESCIEYGWFREGTGRQYDKLFYANANGCSIEEIATIIWVCTNENVWCKRDILERLKILQADYVTRDFEHEF